VSKAYLDFLSDKAVDDLPTGLPEIPALSSHLFEFQHDIVSWALKRGRAAIFADCGMGKGQPIGSKILTDSGWKRNDQLIPSDRIFASDGQSYKLKGVYFRPTQKTWRIHFSDSSSIVVDEEHIHIVRTNNDRQRNKPWREMSTRQLLNCKNLRYGSGNKSRNYDIPIVKPVEFGNRCKRLITPYVMGVLLGDGHLSGNISISSDDKQLIDRVAMELPDGVELHYKGQFDYNLKTGPTGNRRHPFRQELFDNGLIGSRSHNKFIPEEYLRHDDRIELLRGLMDTDGYIDDSGCSQFYSTSEALALGVVELVQSLGGIPTMRRKETTIEGKRYRDCWIVTFSLKTMNPFYLERKAVKWNPNPRDNGRWIDRIEELGEQQTICISVDSPDQSYVTENYVVTHNTPMQLEWAQHVPGRVLIVAPLAVAAQTVAEGVKFGIHCEYAKTLADTDSRIVVTNYERLSAFEPSAFNGVVLDESSILKAFTGKIRNQIIEQFGRVPFRLACTATPAPNDYMELANHAEFVGAMTRTEMLAHFFVHDGGETQKWRLKGHAEGDFWKWLCSWAVMIRKPSDLGYSDDNFILPPKTIHHHTVQADNHDGDMLFAMEARTLQERLAARRGTIDKRAAAVAKLANADDEPWLIWCNLNSESETAAKMIPGAVEVHGSMKPEDKTKAMQDFTNGKIRVLVTKPKIAGFGMNWQHCRNMAFLGLNDSWESYYQAVRRCWRFGQTKPVEVHIVTADIEGAVVANINRKEADANRMAELMVENMSELNKQNIKASSGPMKTDYREDTESGKLWRADLCDCVEGVKAMESDSVGYTIFSPPFASLYTYSASDRDMGNCKGQDDFMQHFGYLIPELYRVTMPGRLLSFHCMNLPTSKARDGFIGVRDFRGALIREFEKAGWIFHSEVCIWKDPVTAMQRTKALGLLHKQVCKDSAMSRQGIPDYLVTMRKPGDNPKPVEGPFDEFVGDPDTFQNTGNLSIDIWQRYASPVWMDVNPSRTLQKKSAREEKDERHICPLQLDVIERGLQLWSMPNDLVLSPFMGIGSEGYCAVKMKRRFIGFELKGSYWNQACKNLKQAEIDAIDCDLFANAGVAE